MMHILNQTATIWVYSRQNSQSYVESYLLHLEAEAEAEQEQALMSLGQVRNRRYDHYALFVTSCFIGIASVGFVG